MKLRSILAVFTLLVAVKGAWMAAIVSPVMLGIGAVLSAIDKEVLNVHPIGCPCCSHSFSSWKSWLPFINKQAAAEPEKDDREFEKYEK